MEDKDKHIAQGIIIGALYCLPVMLAMAITIGIDRPNFYTYVFIGIIVYLIIAHLSFKKFILPLSKKLVEREMKHGR